METGKIRLLLEAHGAQPNYNYDIIRPLIQGRVAIEGAELAWTPPGELAGLFQKPKFREGAFDLLDTNWGDLVRAIDNGWDIRMLPVFIKRKPAYNYLWVRADRGINTPKDLEGRLFTSVGYGSAISIYTRGLLQHAHGVDVSTFRWLVSAAEPFDIHDRRIALSVASGPAKPAAQRLLDGEVDASTGDITDPRLWEALEKSGSVKRMFPDYRELNRGLIRDHGLLTPAHAICISGALERKHPDLPIRVYRAFKAALRTAYDDALADQTSYSMLLDFRELVRDQAREFGDIWRHGVAANRSAIDRFLQYRHEQGITRTRLAPEQVFAKGTLDT